MDKIKNQKTESEMNNEGQQVPTSQSPEMNEGEMQQQQQTDWDKNDTGSLGGETDDSDLFQSDPESALQVAEEDDDEYEVDDKETSN